MSNEGRQPAPEFDSKRYDRPNQDWVCGHACDGCPCRLGPSPSGTCRAGPECKPALVPSTQEGSPGLWKCTRPPSEGGPCPEGPRPDGSCCRSTPPCVPVRSLRARRGLVVRATIAACLGLLLLAIAGPWRAEVLSPGALTSPHSGPAFAAAGLPRDAAHIDAQGCVHCHPAAHEGPAGWTATALAVSTGNGPLAPGKLLAAEARDFGPMDAACQSCHQPHSFHQASITQDMSCSVCHLEHQGADHDLLAVASRHCTDCHGDSAQMLAAGAKALELPHELFEKILPAGLSSFPVARPAAGLTARITSFAEDHPEFRLHLDGAIDPTPLAFNHARHLTGPDIPTLNGQPLDCRSCHVPDSAGINMLPVSFEQNCRACHDLGIDPSTPGINVPHGDVLAARAFLRALPAAYTDHAVRRLGLSGEPLRAHVEQKLDILRQRHPVGEALERRVFFGDPAPPAGGESCRLCHTVEARPAGAAPHIPTPRPPDVWMPRARFDHSRHTQLSCTACHSAETSLATTDILMPTHASCASCHSPAGGVTDSCTACHGYHNPPPAGLPRKTAGMPDALRRALASAP